MFEGELQVLKFLQGMRTDFLNQFFEGKFRRRDSVYDTGALSLSRHNRLRAVSSPDEARGRDAALSLQRDNKGKGGGI